MLCLSFYGWAAFFVSPQVAHMVEFFKVILLRVASSRRCSTLCARSQTSLSVSDVSEATCLLSLLFLFYLLSPHFAFYLPDPGFYLYALCAPSPP